MSNKVLETLRSHLFGFSKLPLAKQTYFADDKAINTFVCSVYRQFNIDNTPYTTSYGGLNDNHRVNIEQSLRAELAQLINPEASEYSLALAIEINRATLCYYLHGFQYVPETCQNALLRMSSIQDLLKNIAEFEHEISVADIFFGAFKLIKNSFQQVMRSDSKEVSRHLEQDELFRRRVKIKNLVCSTMQDNDSGAVDPFFLLKQSCNVALRSAVLTKRHRLNLILNNINATPIDADCKDEDRFVQLYTQLLANQFYNSGKVTAELRLIQRLSKKLSPYIQEKLATLNYPFDIERTAESLSLIFSKNLLLDYEADEQLLQRQQGINILIKAILDRSLAHSGVRQFELCNKAMHYLGSIYTSAQTTQDDVLRMAGTMVDSHMMLNAGGFIAPEDPFGLMFSLFAAYRHRNTYKTIRGVTANFFGPILKEWDYIQNFDRSAFKYFKMSVPVLFGLAVAIGVTTALCAGITALLLPTGVPEILVVAIFLAAIIPGGLASRAYCSMQNTLRQFATKIYILWHGGRYKTPEFSVSNKLNSAFGATVALRIRNYYVVTIKQCENNCNRYAQLSKHHVLNEEEKQIFLQCTYRRLKLYLEWKKLWHAEDMDSGAALTYEQMRNIFRTRLSSDGKHMRYLREKTRKAHCEHIKRISTEQYDYLLRSLTQGHGMTLRPTTQLWDRTMTLTQHINRIHVLQQQIQDNKSMPSASQGMRCR